MFHTMTELSTALYKLMIFSKISPTTYSELISV